MREIIFRGKRTDSGKWIFGDLIQDDLDTYIRQIYHEWWEQVDPDTVSQFTGLCDKNGERIFEGSLLKICSWVRGTKAEGEKREDIAEVQYNSNTGGFKLKVYHNGKYKRISKFSAGHLFAYRAEVIGNKWDNPELLNE